MQSGVPDQGREPSNVAMPCEEAYALLKMAGSKKVRVTGRLLRRCAIAWRMAASTRRRSRRARFSRDRCRSAAGSTRSTIRRTRATCVPSSAWPGRAEPAVCRRRPAAAGAGVPAAGDWPVRPGRSRSADAGNADAGAWAEDAIKEAVARHQPAAPRRADAAAAGNGFGRRAGAANKSRRQFGMRGT